MAIVLKFNLDDINVLEKPYYVDVLIINANIKFQIDTGCSCTCISDYLYRNKFANYTAEQLFIMC